MSTTRRFLTARWHHLAMLNYEVDAAVLEKYLPNGTELDTFDDKHFVSVVAFKFLDTRLLGIPIPLHQNFDEVNLRFYVRRHHKDEIRRGVVFIKEIVPKPAIAWTARLIYNENYIYRRMSHVDGIGSTNKLTYNWSGEKQQNKVSLQIEGDAYLADPSSEECFITEHYWGYARQRNGGTVEYQVEHPRWKVWQAKKASLECNIAALYGDEFVPYLSKAPSSVFLADGSEVTVYTGRKLED